MRRQRVPSTRAAAVVVAGLALVVAGCSRGDDAARGPVPTAATTTVAPATTTSTTTSTTLARATTTTTTPPTTLARPVLVEGIPQVTATPARGPIGARVRIEGTGFTDQMWRSTGQTLWLTGSGGPGCLLYGEADHSVTVAANGRMTGEFVVPISGGCRMGTDPAERPVTAGAHRIAFACTACVIGSFEVTSSATRCANVGFTPNSDDVAGSILAANLTCTEAEALVRKVGARVGAVGGPTRVEADGFVCVRTGQFEGRGLPVAYFRCTSGLKTVTFDRT